MSLERLMNELEHKILSKGYDEVKLLNIKNNLYQKGVKENKMELCKIKYFKKLVDIYNDIKWN